MGAAEEYAQIIRGNSQQAVRSAKETILETLGRPLDDALRLEAIYGYTGAADLREVKERTARLFDKYR
jgi:enoyl-CoA hydratase